jgi:hypothetical protein
LTATDVGLGSRYHTTAAGVTYTGKFGWGNFSGQYERTLGVGSIIGQRGRIEGQNYALTVQPGHQDALQLAFSVHGTDQIVHTEIPANEHSFATDVSLGVRTFGQYSIQLGGGWQQGTFTNSGTNFHTDGYTGRAGIEHPRFQLSGSYNSNIGTALQPYNLMSGGVGVDSALLTPLRLIPSDLRGIMFSLHANPFRKMELSALYTRSVQHMEGIVANDFEIIDAHATFHFRRLEFVAGFFGSTQIYSSYLATYPQTERGRYYVRISRTVKFL